MRFRPQSLAILFLLFTTFATGLLLFPRSAHAAATMDIAGGTATYNAGSYIINNLTITFDDVGNTFTFQESGETISLGKTILLASKTTVGIVRTGQTTIERLAGTFTYRGLLRLTGAKKVFIKVGRLEFELKERHLEALRDLASRMVP